VALEGLEALEKKKKMACSARLQQGSWWRPHQKIELPPIQCRSRSFELFF
jgi:hypothetical protein